MSIHKEKKNNKPKNPPKIAIKFSNTIFILSIFFSILIIFYAIYKIYNPTNFNEVAYNSTSIKFYIICILCGGLSAILFFIGLKKIDNNLRVNLSLLYLTVITAFYGFETYLNFNNYTIRNIQNLDGYISGHERAKLAKKIGISYDTRTYLEALNDLGDINDIGDINMKISPNISARKNIKENGKIIYTLGGISNNTTLFRNEGGFYPIIKNDEHGFNNPKGLYKKNEVDILLIGDSFAEGVSVQSNENISSVLREQGFNTLTVGKGGNGPLTELASLKEYGDPLKPKIVLWLYLSINDMIDLKREMNSPILMKYLNVENFSQNLISRQKEIDTVLIDHAKYQWQQRIIEVKKMKETIWKNKLTRVINILKLSELRKLINLTNSTTLEPIFQPPPIFIDILNKSNQMVSSWNGKMYFVYLPSYERYFKGKDDKNLDFVLKALSKLNIPLIDLHKEVFKPHPDPLSLFPFRMLAHYNAEGYRLIAEAINVRLREDGYKPIKKE